MKKILMHYVKKAAAFIYLSKPSFGRQRIRGRVKFVNKLLTNLPARYDERAIVLYKHAILGNLAVPKS